MTTSASRSFMSIGEVLGQLRPDFPDVTISKIRFLEAEGLVEPERTPAGYRKFSRDDVARLRFVLSAQRDRYLPLRVIKDHLEAIDRGLEPSGEAGMPARVPRALVSVDEYPSAKDFAPDPSEVRLTRDELLGASGLQPAALEELERFGVLGPRAGTAHYDGDSLVVAKAVAEMARFGLEPRHLRPYRTAADREVGLFEQVVSPLARQRGPEAAARADEAIRELAALSVRLHAALVRAGLRRSLGR